MILVTGGNGFVGSHVVHALRTRDLPVRTVVRERAKGRKLEAWGCELAVGDLTERASLAAAVAGCDTVVHLAAIRQGKPEEFRRVMVEGTRDLMEAAKAAGVRRWIQMSALGTTEETKDLVPYYGAKWEQEKMVEGSAFEWTIFRPSFIFGRDGGILGTFRRIAKIAPVTPIPGAGEQRIQPIWIDDVAEFFARAVDEARAAGTLIELGGPDAVSWNEFWARLKRVLGMRRPSIHVPMPLMRANAFVTERLPGEIPLTRDLLKMLEAGDNTCDVRPALEIFGMSLVTLDEQLRRAAA